MKFTGIIKFEQSGGVYLGTDAKLTLKGKVQIHAGICPISTAAFIAADKGISNT